MREHHVVCHVDCNDVIADSADESDDNDNSVVDVDDN